MAWKWKRSSVRYRPGPPNLTPTLKRVPLGSNLRPNLAPQGRSGVAADTGKVHTPSMTLKNAALLALIGTILITVLLVWTFVFNVVNVLRGLVPALTLVSSFIYAFACFGVAVFFYVFHRTQS